MRRTFVSAVVIALLSGGGAHAASLNKCIDAQGRVTYSNLPCHNAQKVHAVPIDPPPPAVPARTAPARPAALTKASPSRAEPPALHLETRRIPGPGSGDNREAASKRRCDAIADKLGKVLDKMDQARRKGYTQEQAGKWDGEIKDLERKKQQAGCF